MLKTKNRKILTSISIVAILFISVIGFSITTSVAAEDPLYYSIRVDKKVTVLSDPGNIPVKWEEEVTVNVGDIVGFQIIVANNGTEKLHKVGVVDLLPSCLEYIEGSARPPLVPIPETHQDTSDIIYHNHGCGILLVWYFESGLEPGQEIVITFAATAVKKDNCTNYAVALAPIPDEVAVHCPVIHNFLYFIDDAKINIVDEEGPEPELKVEKQVYDKELEEWVERVEVQKGETVRFRINITYGDYLVPPVLVNDTLPDNLKYQPGSAIPYEPKIINGKYLIWHIHNRCNCEKDIIEFNATAVECGEGMNLVNVTILLSSVVPPHPISYDEDTAVVNVTCDGEEPSPGIELVKSADPTSILPGEEVTYTYEVSNIGNVDLYEVTVIDDQGLVPEYVEGDDSDGILNPGETWTYQNITVLYESTTNIGTAKAKTIDQIVIEHSNNTFVEVLPNVQISIKKLAKGCCGEWSNSVEVGLNGIVYFNLSVENTGDETIDVTVEDKLPEGLEYNIGSAEPEEPTIEGKNLTWEITGLAPTDKSFITFNVIADECGTQVNNLIVTIKDYGYEYSDSATVEVTCPDQNIQLFISKPIEEGGFIYINNNPVCMFPINLIFGGIDINVTVVDPTMEATNVVFYINDEEVDNQPYDPANPYYIYPWYTRAFFLNTIEVEVLAGSDVLASKTLDVFAFIS